MIAALLLGCAPRLGLPAVTRGPATPIPLVRTASDARWYVPVEVEGHGPWVWFFDSGYSHSTCDDGLADALGLRPRGRTTIRGELGRLTAKKARLPRLELGGQVLDGLVCQVRDLGSTSSIRDPREVRVAGVLGMDALRPFTVRLDPVDGAVWLDPPGSLPEGAGVRIRRELRVGIRAVVPLEVDGAVLWPVLDTGASGSHLRLDRLGLEPTTVREGVVVRGTGATGEAVRTIATYQLPDVALGGVIAGPVVATGRERGRGAGLLGLNVLSRYRSTLDFRARRAVFERVEPTRLPTWSEWRDAGGEGAARLGRQPAESVRR